MISKSTDLVVETLATQNASGESRYERVRPHARGGLGEVFVAKDLELNREVALKEIQPQFADNTNSRYRFVLEAEVTGGLEHPGIVPVYGLGQYEDGRPYYAMRFIQGDSLKDAIKQFHEDTSHDESERTLKLRKLLGRFVDVCQAISYAHSRGVLHRDLKPGNIMLGKFGETLVVDWGLAKVANQDEPTQNAEEQTFQPQSGTGINATVMGNAIGTPAYMSPEQAAGRLDELAPASDVYSLGATLYHLLTGQSPFSGSDLLTTLEHVKQGNFPAPSTVKPKVSKPIEAVCLKAMAVKPPQRYESAEQLAADIERFLADEPVSAMVEPVTVKAKRWIKRHQLLCATSAAVLMVSAIAVGLFQKQARDTAVEEARVQAETAKEQRRLRDLAAENAKLAAEQRDTARSALGNISLLQGFQSVEANQFDQASLWFAESNSYSRGNPGSAMRVYETIKSCSIPVAAWQTDKFKVRSLHMHPDDSHVLVNPLSEPARIYDVTTQDKWTAEPKQAFQVAKWNPDGSLLAMGTATGMITVCDFPGGETRFEKQLDASVTGCWFSHNGQWLAVAHGHTVSLFDTQNLGLENQDPGLTNSEANSIEWSLSTNVDALSFSDNDQFVSVAGGDDHAHVYHISERRERQFKTPLQHFFSTAYLSDSRSPISQPPFIVGGRIFLYEYGDRLVERDFESEQKVAVHTANKPGVFTIDPLRAYAVIQENESVKGGKPQNGAYVRNVQSQTRLIQCAAHRNVITCASFNTPFEQLATASLDGTVQINKVADGSLIGQPLVHQGTVQRMGFGTRRLATLQESGLLRVWSIGNSEPQLKVAAKGGWTLCRPSHDHSQLLTCGIGFKNYGIKNAISFSTEKASQLQPITVKTPIVDAIFLSNPRYAALATGKEIHLRDSETGKPISEPLLFDANVKSIDYSHSQKTLAALLANGKLTLTKINVQGIAETPRILSTSLEPGSDNTNDWANNGLVRYSSDGTKVVCCALNGHFFVTDIPTGESFAGEHTAKCHTASFSKSGDHLVTGGFDRQVKVWDVKTKTCVATIAHSDWLLSAVFHPHKSRVLTGCRNRSARIFDWETSESIVTFQHPDEVTAAEFAHDGRIVVTACKDYFIRVWDAVDGKQIAPARIFKDSTGAHIPLRLNALAKQNQVVVSGLSPEVQVFALPTINVPVATVDSLTSLSELVSSYSIKNSSLVERINPATWMENWPTHRASFLRLERTQMERFSKTVFSDAEASLINRQAWKSVVSGRRLSDSSLKNLSSICDQYNKGVYFNTLGGALYRAGRYNAAIDACLKSVEKTPAEMNLPGPHPADLAFVAMSYQRLGNRPLADKFRRQMQDAMEVDVFKDDSESKELVREVDQLFEEISKPE